MHAVTLSAIPAQRPRWLGLAVVVAALAAIASGWAMSHDPVSVWRWLHWASKPLATCLIGLLVYRSSHPVSLRYRRWIGLGVACSLVGDVLLMLPQNLFVPGLLAFLCGHLCFLTALLGDSRFAARPLLLGACLAVAALNIYLLWDVIGAGLRVPVMVYAAVLASMAGQALVRARLLHERDDPQARAAALAAAGALVFMLSDGLLAWNRFHAAIPGSSLWVLSTYYLALWWIACSVQRRDTLAEAGASH